MVHLRWPKPNLAWLVLDNPEASNAMSINMMDQLVQHCHEICSQSADVVVISAKQAKVFCAGGDLQDVRDHLCHKEAAEAMHEKMKAALSSFRTENIFCIVAQEGPAVGGGAELTTYGDFVVAAEKSYIRFVHSRLGVSPGWGGAMRLIEKIGRHAARQVLVGARKYYTEEGLRIQLIDQVVPAREVLPVAMELAERIATFPIAKRKIMSFCQHPSQQREKELFLSLWGEEDHLKAMGFKKNT